MRVRISDKEVLCKKLDDFVTVRFTLVSIPDSHIIGEKIMDSDCFHKPSCPYSDECPLYDEPASYQMLNS